MLSEKPWSLSKARCGWPAEVDSAASFPAMLVTSGSRKLNFFLGLSCCCWLCKSACCGGCSITGRVDKIDWPLVAGGVVAAAVLWLRIETGGLCGSPTSGACGGWTNRSVEALSQLSDRSRNRCLSIFILDKSRWLEQLQLLLPLTKGRTGSKPISHLSTEFTLGASCFETDGTTCWEAAIVNERSTRRKPGRWRTERTPVRLVAHSRETVGEERTDTQSPAPTFLHPPSLPRPAAGTTWEHDQEDQGSALLFVFLLLQDACCFPQVPFFPPDFYLD